MAIDPTPGTGTYDPSVNCESCQRFRELESVSPTIQKIMPASKKINDFPSDNCDQSHNSKFGFGYCNDGTISFNQPPSEGMVKQEGFCGQTAISNLYHMYCGWNLDVLDVDEYYANDLTPGIRAGTLVNGANKLFNNNSDCPNGKFKASYSKNEKDFISSVLSATHQTVGLNQLVRTNNLGRQVKRAPVVILVAIPGEKVLHWISVVDVEFENRECRMILNHWGQQNKVPCDYVAKLSREAHSKFSGIVVSPYTMVEFTR